MGTERIYFGSESDSFHGSMSVQTIDATFRHKGQKVNMYFHCYLGPSFFLVENGEEVDIYPDETQEYEHIWKQFYGWWVAKGRHIYKNEGFV